MNEFTSQFLLEARELTEQATADLLALERNTAEVSHLDGAFRAFHTLKGAAGIMEYEPMERMLHRAEDVLQGLRSGKAAATPVVIDGCLVCIGQVIRWLDDIERDGELPAGADDAGVRITRLLDAPVSEETLPSRSWVNDLLAWAKDKISAGSLPTRHAIRYMPAPDAFFQGHDPVAQISDLPGLLAIRLMPRTPWPTLETMQPFDSNLIIEALSSASRAEKIDL
ncbi:MAG: hypothetical protein EON93_04275 [Burkholderiales bacterium]|nr:MAG: hypothetical protein EON93_04275 [Burkholderiales bacterium]